MMTTFIRLSLLMSAVLLLSGCAHQLEIKNIGNYRTFQLSALEQPEEQQLVMGVGHALDKYPTKVVYPYTSNNHQKVDIVANIGIKSRYEGAGTNFLVSFPGFLIWAPAGFGYTYYATYDFYITLTRVSDGARIDSWPMTVRLDLRHADFGRTWVEMSWFEVGILAFIGGVAFTQYDDDVTPILIDRIATPIGSYVAEEISRHINNNLQMEPAAPNAPVAPTRGL